MKDISDETKKITMKKFSLFALIYLVVVTSSAQTQLPSVQLSTLKGETISSTALLNDKVPVVISFWSTICKPCIEELNAFKDQWAKWQKEVNFQLVAVSTDDARSVARVRGFAASREWPFTILLDKNQDFKRALNVNSIPQLYIIGTDGKIVYSHIGYTPGSETKVLEVLKGL